MLNTFVENNIVAVACAESAQRITSVCRSHKRFNTITTTTNAAT
ncbi:hypothetical protein [Limnohabitans sp. 2KL-1]|jgi:hypothetical protein|nr:hypothetical protein [Limnohabitans sp. 2KL-1]